MSNVACFSVNHFQSSSNAAAFSCNKQEHFEAGTCHLIPPTDVAIAAEVPSSSFFSGLCRPLSAAPPILNKLPKCLVSGTASGSFRSSSACEDVLDGAPPSQFIFPPLSCCRTSAVTADHSDKAEIETKNSDKEHSAVDDVESITVSQLASSLSATGIDSRSEAKPCQFLVAAIVDCRSFIAYNVNHVMSAFNASCGDRTSQKRLISGKATVADFVSGGSTPEPRDRFREVIRASATDGGTIVAYDDNATCVTSLPATHPLRLVSECLRKMGAAVKFLHGGLHAFFEAYPALCSRPCTPPSRPFLFSPTTPAVEMGVDSTEMSQILPFVFIGNERDAANRELLERSKVSHVLNVTSHVPLHFENEARNGITYKRLAATDSCSQNLKQYFEEAIEFIESARISEGKVLVHCQAGVSRSPAIVIAYLMARFNLTLMAAFDFAKSRRNIVAPNLHFMGQLLEFETKCVAGEAKHCLSGDAPVLPETASSS